VRAPGALVLLLAIAALSAGCAESGGDDEPAAGPPPPAQTTSEAIRTAVFERAYSECATHPMVRLATRYDVDPNVDAVSKAVARFWTRQFKGGQDAIPVGVQACIDGFNDPVGNPA
jgi:hypothetical protein